MRKPDSAYLGGRPTLSDIAASVGVSKITVSRALRDSELVKPDVKQRIRDAAAGMGYRPNIAARDLRLRQSLRISVVIDMKASADRPMYDPYPLALLGGIVQECASAGLSVVLTTSDGGISPETQDASGIILLGQGAHHHAVHELAALGLPLAVWGADDGVERKMGVAVVGSDNRLGGCLAARHMLARERRGLLFLGDTSHAEISDRLAGFAGALAGSDARLVGELPCDFTSESGRAAMREWVAGGVPFDGLFAASDLMAIGAMRAMREAGLQPGNDVTVVGYDDSPAAASHSPGLTSVRQDWTAGGQLLAATLLSELDPARYPAPESRILPTEITVRDS
jgi:DNA-binding LacI/PurR family transcriptional regulator